jgi:DNA primase
MALGPVKGGACWLSQPGPHLVVTEGIEDGLSVREATGLPVWVGLSAGGVTSLELPELVSMVTIAADPDAAGMAAAEAAVKRWTALGVAVRVSPAPNGDYNDMARQEEGARA